jgi:Bacterial protein of unknown function (DUF916)
MVRRRVLTATGVVALTVSLLLGVVGLGHVQAAQSAAVGPGNALKVSPVRLDLTMSPGTTQTFSVHIQNLTGAPAVLHPAINDFVASGDESGRPNVILNENEFAPSHSLKRLVTPLKDFTVQPGETREVKVTVAAPKNVAAGGYFGAVRFAPANAEGDKNVNLAASVGTLVLLKMSGDIKEELTIASFDARKKAAEGQANTASSFFTSKKDVQAVVRFKNSGNVQVEPFGAVRLKRFGKVVATYEINKQDVRGNVLPDSVRKFEVPLDKLGSFGKYTLEGNFGYGETGQLLSAQTTFYVVPLLLILIGLGVVALLVVLIVVLPRMIRSYNRRIIRRANRRR